MNLGAKSLELEFIEISADVIQTLRKAASLFEERYRVKLGQYTSVTRDVVEQTLRLFLATPRERYWGAYLAVDAGSRQVVGSCAFKSGPNRNGEVEIAYFTYPSFEGRGYATRMAAELTKKAIQPGTVQRIVAHTLPEKNASTRVLEKNDFHVAGESVDPDDGRVWKWERALIQG